MAEQPQQAAAPAQAADTTAVDSLIDSWDLDNEYRDLYRKGIAGIVQTVLTTRRHMEEVEQRLNRDLADFLEDHGLQLPVADLKKDIGEKNDLSEQMPEKVAEMREKLRSWRERVGM